MFDIEKHFTAKPDKHGGVTLALRTKFRDQLATEIDPDGVARSKTPTDENGITPMEDIVYVFGPLTEGKTARLVTQSNGTIAVVVSREPDDVLGDTVTSGAGIVSAETTGDRRTIYRTGTLGGEARQLASMNAINKAHYKR